MRVYYIYYLNVQYSIILTHIYITDDNEFIKNNLIRENSSQFELNNAGTYIGVFITYMNCLMHNNYL